MLIVITGPIASGKSTIAKELAGQLERAGVRAAVIDLDLVRDRLVTDGAAADASSWTLARRDTAVQAAALIQDGFAVVADGSFNLPSDRAALVDHLPPRSDPVFVTLRVSYEEALRRAREDPTRGVSRDPQFLGATTSAAATRWRRLRPPTSSSIRSAPRRSPQRRRSCAS